MASEDSVEIHFAVGYNTQWGENVLVLGSATTLGSWNVSKASPLKWDDGLWRGTVVANKSEFPVEYKYLVAQGELTPGQLAQIMWEPGTNHVAVLEQADVFANDEWNAGDSAWTEVPLPDAAEEQHINDVLERCESDKDVYDATAEVPVTVDQSDVGVVVAEHGEPAEAGEPVAAVAHSVLHTKAREESVADQVLLTKDSAVADCAPYATASVEEQHTDDDVYNATAEVPVTVDQSDVGVVAEQGEHSAQGEPVAAVAQSVLPTKAREESVADQVLLTKDSTVADVAPFATASVEGGISLASAVSIESVENAEVADGVASDAQYAQAVPMEPTLTTQTSNDSYQTAPLEGVLTTQTTTTETIETSPTDDDTQSDVTKLESVPSANEHGEQRASREERKRLEKEEKRRKKEEKKRKEQEKKAKDESSCVIQ